MRCKPGDLAVVVWAQCSQNIGALVKVLRAWDGIEQFSLNDRFMSVPEPTWVVESLGRPLIASTSSGTGFMVRPYSDRCLRPIRPGDTADSTETMKEKEAA